MNASLEPVHDGGPGARRAALAVLAAALLVAGAAFAGSGFPIDPRLATPAPSASGSGPASAPALASASAFDTTTVLGDLPVATCPAEPTPPSGLEITQPAPGSIWSTEGLVPIAGRGAPLTGRLMATLDQDTGTIVARIAADGSFAANLIVYPAAGRTRTRLTISWNAPGAPEPCLLTLGTVDFTLEPIVPISVWLVGGPPRHVPGPPYSVTVAALPSVEGVSASLLPDGSAPIAAVVGPAGIVAKRARIFILDFPDTLPRGPARLLLRWTGPAAGSLDMAVAIVEPEVELP